MTEKLHNIINTDSFLHISSPNSPKAQTDIPVRVMGQMRKYSFTASAYP